MAYNFGTESSEMVQITDDNEHPMDLFKIWLTEAETYDKNNWNQVMNIATIHQANRVLSRNVLLRKFDRSGFVFITERNSRKYIDLKQNPSIAATFFWNYKINDKKIRRQVRINGTTSELSPENISKFYAEEGLAARIRCKICKCGAPCDIDELKRNHDRVLENFRNGTETLDQNENYTAMLIKPQVVDFYYSQPKCVGDRILYNEDNDGNWSHQHICA